MTLTSALEDLRSTTLKTIAGGLRRLEYLSGLKDPAGHYSHWGLAKVHGDLAAAMSYLLEDLDQSSRQAGMPALAYLERLRARGLALLPAEASPGYAPHLSSALLALWCLAKAHPHFSSRLSV